MRSLFRLAGLIFGGVVALCGSNLHSAAMAQSAVSPSALGEQIAEAAMARTRHSVRYDPSYVKLTYPGGDVAPDRGVCADVVIRVLRTVGLDLQLAVHEDMKTAFSAYPKHWGLTRTDRNIDHRRVPNLEVYFHRIGAEVPLSTAYEDYLPGDIVAWNLRGDSGGWLPHIGIVSNRTARSGNPIIVHNMGAGPRAEDVLFSWPMTGHFRLKNIPSR